MNQFSHIDLELLYKDTGLSSHMEDYMEAIVILTSDNRVVRVKDIAKKLNIKMPSVTAALNKLKELHLIEYEKYGFIELTNDGRIIADRVYNKHACLSGFFKKVLTLNPENADSEACKVEHVLSTETCIRLHKFMDFIGEEEENKEGWIDRLHDRLK
ncbi:MAG: metal-dependent transcriptional regulator [Spirochaetae bacterium HGW-Spirochaetae-1]|nr:MAG: metal-dependent transcriptional regulator [Spirochaetae bacterium HGW-Spirochaetae-1]